MDARYEKVRESGQIRDVAVFLPTGIAKDDERQVLCLPVSLSEHETHWKVFLKCLKERGLKDPDLITSHAHEDLG